MFSCDQNLTSEWNVFFVLVNRSVQGTHVKLMESSTAVKFWGCIDNLILDVSFLDY